MCTHYHSDGTHDSNGMDPEFWVLDVGGPMGMGVR